MCVQCCVVGGGQERPPSLPSLRPSLRFVRLVHNRIALASEEASEEASEITRRTFVFLSFVLYRHSLEFDQTIWHTYDGSYPDDV